MKVVGHPSPTDGGLVQHEDLGLKVGLLPWVSARAIVKVEDIMGKDPDQHAGKYEDRVRRVVDALTADMDFDTVNILVSHLTVYGGLAGGGERTAHIFGYAIPTSLFPGHLSYVALGHLHRQQKMPHSSPVWYSGSPLQLDFGEVNDQKGALWSKPSQADRPPSRNCLFPPGGLSDNSWARWVRCSPPPTTSARLTCVSFSGRRPAPVSPTR